VAGAAGVVVVSEGQFPPSARRLREALRREGWPWSPLLTGAVGWLAGLAALWVWGGEGWAALEGFAARCWGGPGAPGVVEGAALALWLWAPLGLWAAASVALAGLAQVGGLRAWGAGRGAGGVWLGLGLGLGFCALGSAALWGALPWLGALARARPAEGLWALWRGLGPWLGWGLGLWVAVGVAELGWRRWRWWRGLWVSRAEALRERRAQEGDPALRRLRRRWWRGAAGDGDAGAAAVAAVVVWGEAGAVALSWVEGWDEAPRVVARGQGASAARVLAVARAAGRPVVADEALARALVVLPAGAVVPVGLFGAVARVLVGVRRASGAP
jgi:type III secretion system FlhB-like substrate exporter